ncbi:glycine/D-amino acid oxidase-like deaminating enzyme [Breoghania corrubedonensis]|uniref:Glycine/D-amino acid oxidase-like deaminating enzyme n=1 Tax=Breoghania corrubedonensis TaxID=665038 RepID=A0A2T5V1F2_9HYPH|nr:FAD-dependent oxidoreductase [Breoghania corrubedonensis]PTW57572.1 glycine/D-amino acid oxidase-like deaminating enzyme [Breoghania corrubedonensis]
MPLYSPHAYDRTRPLGSYWETTVEPEARNDSALEGDAQADFAIVGGGFTGLNAALRLATRHSADVALLEAGDIGWGASGRNGGFCCVGGSKRSLTDLVRHYGHDETARFLDFQAQAIEHVRDLLATHGVDADTHSDGELSLAYREKAVRGLQEEAAQLRSTFGIELKIHSRAELAEMGVAGPEFFGGATLDRGFALNPLKYAKGLARAARDAGAKLYRRSAVTSICRENGGWRLDTAHGRLFARRLVMATNGYLEEGRAGTPFKALEGRLLPVLSSVLVTRPLTADELAAQGWTSHQMAYDTRRLLHYFRLMPDGRFLFGMRGGTNTTPRCDVKTRREILADFHRMFPAWRDVEVTHVWSGFVCMSANLNPYVGPLDTAPDAFAALAYHGNGVAMGSRCGVAVADMAAGATTPADLPAVIRGPLKRFPFPTLRKAYLKAAYRWYALCDEVF